ncbi:hypothetical protein [Mycobacterium sp. DBP42]|uniref:hypothetical protein n=1 Tax=Mycobacteriaceae TaxID=1762 RepID=UPI00110CBB91|nr:hypothetical protein [Mycobacterium sp. DBP42]TMS50692.1 hypothetical protein E0T84_22660 [Mycobacterium sp. DBP42]
MFEITVKQYRDDDDDIITTASTDPEAVEVSVMTTGRVIDVNLRPERVRPLGGEGFAEVFVACAQAAYGSRYDSLLADHLVD